MNKVVETIQQLAERIICKAGVGETPILVDGNTRLQLVKLSHTSFCFQNLGYGNDMWLVWSNWNSQPQLPIKQIGIGINPEISAIFHPPPIAEGLGPLVPVPDKDKNMFDGLWWSRGLDLFFEVSEGICWLLDDDGFRLGRENFAWSSGYLENRMEYVDERHASTRSHPQGSTRPWPQVKGKFREFSA